MLPPFPDIPLRCPICCAAVRPAFIAGAYRMYRCVACGTSFANPMPPPDELSAFYSGFHRSDEEGGWYGQVQYRVNSDVNSKVSVVERTAGRGASLLDVGCGKGYFVRACIERGIRGQGLDLSDTAVAYARGRLGITAHCGDLASLKCAIGRFRAVTLWATIEHVPEPARLLADIADVTEPGGYLFLDTGIADDWLERLLPGVTQWYDPPQHLWVFSARGLLALLRSAGFSPLCVDTCFERNRVRKAVRMVRGAAAAVGLRIVAAATRLSRGGVDFTRYPLGNLMSVVARRNTT